MGRRTGCRIFLLLDWDYGWTGQHPLVGGSELESETSRGRGAGTSTTTFQSVMAIRLLHNCNGHQTVRNTGLYRVVG
jgi:hypothetical protein